MVVPIDGRSKRIRIYMRYMLCYLDYTYRYVTLYNSEDDPQHYSCTIQLPIYTYNITGYISIDDCRFWKIIEIMDQLISE